MMKPSCKGCENRAQDCHSKCEQYAEWKAEHDAQKAEIDKAKDFEQQKINYIHGIKDVTRRRNHGR